MVLINYDQILDNNLYKKEDSYIYMKILQGDSDNWNCYVYKDNEFKLISKTHSFNESNEIVEDTVNPSICYIRSLPDVYIYNLTNNSSIRNIIYDSPGNWFLKKKLDESDPDIYEYRMNILSKLNVELKLKQKTLDKNVSFNGERYFRIFLNENKDRASEYFYNIDTDDVDNDGLLNYLDKNKFNIDNDNDGIVDGVDLNQETFNVENMINYSEINANINEDKNAIFKLVYEDYGSENKADYFGSKSEKSVEEIKYKVSRVAKYNAEIHIDENLRSFNENIVILGYGDSVVDGGNYVYKNYCINITGYSNDGIGKYRYKKYDSYKSLNYTKGNMFDSETYSYDILLPSQDKFKELANDNNYLYFKVPLKNIYQINLGEQTFTEEYTEFTEDNNIFFNSVNSLINSLTGDEYMYIDTFNDLYSSFRIASISGDVSALENAFLVVKFEYDNYNSIFYNVRPYPGFIYLDDNDAKITYYKTETETKEERMKRRIKYSLYAYENKSFILIQNFTTGTININNLANFIDYYDVTNDIENQNNLSNAITIVSGKYNINLLGSKLKSDFLFNGELYFKLNLKFLLNKSIVSYTPNELQNAYLIDYDYIDILKNNYVFIKIVYITDEQFTNGEYSHNIEDENYRFTRWDCYAYSRNKFVKISKIDTEKNIKDDTRSNTSFVRLKPTLRIYEWSSLYNKELYINNDTRDNTYFPSPGKWNNRTFYLSVPPYNENLTVKYYKIFLDEITDGEEVNTDITQDSDKDGIQDFRDANPNNADADNDGIIDGQDFIFGKIKYDENNINYDEINIFKNNLEYNVKFKISYDTSNNTWNLYGLRNNLFELIKDNNDATTTINIPNDENPKIKIHGWNVQSINNGWDELIYNLVIDDINNLSGVYTKYHKLKYNNILFVDYEDLNKSTNKNDQILFKVYYDLQNKIDSTSKFYLYIASGNTFKRITEIINNNLTLNHISIPRLKLKYPAVINGIYDETLIYNIIEKFVEVPIIGVGTFREGTLNNSIILSQHTNNTLYYKIKINDIYSSNIYNSNLSSLHESNNDYDISDNIDDLNDDDNDGIVNKNDKYKNNHDYDNDGLIDGKDIDYENDDIDNDGILDILDPYPNDPLNDPNLIYPEGSDYTKIFRKEKIFSEAVFNGLGSYKVSLLKNAVNSEFPNKYFLIKVKYLDLTFEDFVKSGVELSIYDPDKKIFEKITSPGPVTSWYVNINNEHKIGLNSDLYKSTGHKIKYYNNNQTFEHTIVIRPWQLNINDNGGLIYSLDDSTTYKRATELRGLETERIIKGSAPKCILNKNADTTYQTIFYIRGSSCLDVDGFVDTLYYKIPYPLNYSLKQEKIDDRYNISNTSYEKTVLTREDLDLDGINDADDKYIYDPDADNDGLIDGIDPDYENPDIDNDGLLDGEDPDPLNSDADNDGLNDFIDPNPLALDNDHDGTIDPFDDDKKVFTHNITLKVLFDNYVLNRPLYTSSLLIRSEYYNHTNSSWDFTKDFEDVMTDMCAEVMKFMRFDYFISDNLLCNLVISIPNDSYTNWIPLNLKNNNETSRIVHDFAKARMIIVKSNLDNNLQTVDMNNSAMLIIFIPNKLNIKKANNYFKNIENGSFETPSDNSIFIISISNTKITINKDFVIFGGLTINEYLEDNKIINKDSLMHINIERPVYYYLLGKGDLNLTDTDEYYYYKGSKLLKYKILDDLSGKLLEGDMTKDNSIILGFEEEFGKFGPMFYKFRFSLTQQIHYIYKDGDLIKSTINDKNELHQYIIDVPMSSRFIDNPIKYLTLREPKLNWLVSDIPTKNLNYNYENLKMLNNSFGHLDLDINLTSDIPLKISDFTSDAKLLAHNFTIRKRKLFVRFDFWIAEDYIFDVNLHIGNKDHNGYLKLNMKNNKYVANNNSLILVGNNKFNLNKDFTYFYYIPYPTSLKSAALLFVITNEDIIFEPLIKGDYYIHNVIVYGTGSVLLTGQNMQKGLNDNGKKNANSKYQLETYDGTKYVGKEFLSNNIKYDVNINGTDYVDLIGNTAYETIEITYDTFSNSVLNMNLLPTADNYKSINENLITHDPNITNLGGDLDSKVIDDITPILIEEITNEIYFRIDYAYDSENEIYFNIKTSMPYKNLDGWYTLNKNSIILSDNSFISIDNANQITDNESIVHILYIDDDINPKSIVIVFSDYDGFFDAGLLQEPTEQEILDGELGAGLRSAKEIIIIKLGKGLIKPLYRTKDNDGNPTVSENIAGQKIRIISFDDNITMIPFIQKGIDTMLYDGSTQYDNTIFSRKKLNELISPIVFKINILDDAIINNDDINKNGVTVKCEKINIIKRSSKETDIDSIVALIDNDNYSYKLLRHINLVPTILNLYHFASDLIEGGCINNSYDKDEYVNYLNETYDNDILINDFTEVCCNIKKYFGLVPPIEYISQGTLLNFIDSTSGNLQSNSTESDLINLLVDLKEVLLNYLTVSPQDFNPYDILKNKYGSLNQTIIINNLSKWNNFLSDTLKKIILTKNDKDDIIKFMSQTTITSEQKLSIKIKSWFKKLLNKNIENEIIAILNKYKDIDVDINKNDNKLKTLKIGNTNIDIDKIKFIVPTNKICNKFILNNILENIPINIDYRTRQLYPFHPIKLNNSGTTEFKFYVRYESNLSKKFINNPLIKIGDKHSGFIDLPWECNTIQLESYFNDTYSSSNGFIKLIAPINSKQQEDTSNNTTINTDNVEANENNTKMMVSSINTHKSGLLVYILLPQKTSEKNGILLAFTNKNIILNDQVKFECDKLFVFVVGTGSVSRLNETSEGTECYTYISNNLGYGKFRPIRKTSSFFYRTTNKFYMDASKLPEALSPFEIGRYITKNYGDTFDNEYYPINPLIFEFTTLYNSDGKLESVSSKLGDTTLLSSGSNIMIPSYQKYNINYVPTNGFDDAENNLLLSDTSINISNLPNNTYVQFYSNNLLDDVDNLITKLIKHNIISRTKIKDDDDKIQKLDLDYDKNDLIGIFGVSNIKNYESLLIKLNSSNITTTDGISTISDTAKNEIKTLFNTFNVATNIKKSQSKIINYYIDIIENPEQLLGLDKCEEITNETFTILPEKQLLMKDGLFMAINFLKYYLKLLDIFYLNESENIYKKIQNKYPQISAEINIFDIYKNIAHYTYVKQYNVPTSKTLTSTHENKYNLPVKNTNLSSSTLDQAEAAEIRELIIKIINNKKVLNYRKDTSTIYIYITPSDTDDEDDDINQRRKYITIIMKLSNGTDNYLKKKIGNNYIDIDFNNFEIKDLTVKITFNINNTQIEFIDTNNLTIYIYTNPTTDEPITTISYSQFFDRSLTIKYPNNTELANISSVTTKLDNLEEQLKKINNFYNEEGHYLLEYSLISNMGTIDKAIDGAENSKIAPFDTEPSVSKDTIRAKILEEFIDFNVLRSVFLNEFKELLNIKQDDSSTIINCGNSGIEVNYVKKNLIQLESLMELKLSKTSISLVDKYSIHDSEIPEVIIENGKRTLKSNISVPIYNIDFTPKRNSQATIQTLFSELYLSGKLQKYDPKLIIANYYGSSIQNGISAGEYPKGYTGYMTQTESGTHESYAEQHASLIDKKEADPNQSIIINSLSNVVAGSDATNDNRRKISYTKKGTSTVVAVGSKVLLKKAATESAKNTIKSRQSSAGTVINRAAVGAFVALRTYNVLNDPNASDSDKAIEISRAIVGESLKAAIYAKTPVGKILMVAAITNSLPIYKSWPDNVPGKDLALVAQHSIKIGTKPLKGLMDDITMKPDKVLMDIGNRLVGAESIENDIKSIGKGVEEWYDQIKYLRNNCAQPLDKQVEAYADSLKDADVETQLLTGAVSALVVAGLVASAPVSLPLIGIVAGASFLGDELGFWCTNVSHIPNSYANEGTIFIPNNNKNNCINCIIKENDDGDVIIKKVKSEYDAITSVKNSDGDYTRGPQMIIQSLHKDIMRTKNKIKELEIIKENNTISDELKLFITNTENAFAANYDEYIKCYNEFVIFNDSLVQLDNSSDLFNDTIEKIKLCVKETFDVLINIKKSINKISFELEKSDIYFEELTIANENTRKIRIPAEFNIENYDKNVGLQNNYYIPINKTKTGKINLKIGTKINSDNYCEIRDELEYILPNKTIKLRKIDNYDTPIDIDIEDGEINNNINNLEFIDENGTSKFKFNQVFKFDENENIVFGYNKNYDVFDDDLRLNFNDVIIKNKADLIYNPNTDEPNFICDKFTVESFSNVRSTKNYEIIIGMDPLITVPAGTIVKNLLGDSSSFVPNENELIPTNPNIMNEYTIQSGGSYIFDSGAILIIPENTEISNIPPNSTIISNGEITLSFNREHLACFSYNTYMKLTNVFPEFYITLSDINKNKKIIKSQHKIWGDLEFTSDHPFIWNGKLINWENLIKENNMFEGYEIVKCDVIYNVIVTKKQFDQNNMFIIDDNLHVVGAGLKELNKKQFEYVNDLFKYKDTMINKYKYLLDKK
jgi:hypothetical protein